MPKRNIEDLIASLGRLKDAERADSALASLRRALTDRVNLVVAKAAQVAAEMQLKQLIPDLVSTFNRLLAKGAETDPQCWGKNAIAKALTALDHDESAPFLQGCRYVQMEAAWGGKTDTAVTLRSLCTLALIQCADLPRREKLRHLVESLTDTAETVRIDAIRALEQLEGEEPALLLRLKAGIGDNRAAVVGQALESLLRTEGDRGLEFARRFLVERDTGNASEFASTADELIEQSALALGASRLPAALDVLKQAWDNQPKQVFLHAISASRHESGFDILLTLIRGGRERDAAAAIDALSLHRDSPKVRASVLRAVEARDSRELCQRFEEKFGTG